jgi:hypothetical protein
MENGKWKMENGKWKMENGKWKMQNGSVSSAFSVQATTNFALFGIKYVATLGDSTTVVIE